MTALWAPGQILSGGITPAVSVVIPTFNEAGNIAELADRLARAIPADLPCEVIFVDDSVDHTPDVIETVARESPLHIRLIHRAEPIGGLGGAVVEGLQEARAEWVVVMDADLQHPPSLVPELIATGLRSGADLVVASRYTSGGSKDGLDNRYRVLVSSLATRLTKALFTRRLRGISDPMSGFFAVRRAAVEPERLRPLGYKILLELAVRCRFGLAAEVPYEFGERFSGTSKSSLAEGLRFLRHLAVLRLASASPWLTRCAIAATGVGIALLRPGPWLAFAVLLLGIGFARVAGWHGRQLRVIVLALGTLVSAVDYLAWRLSVLSWSLPGLFVGVLLLLAELHAALHTVGLHTTVWPQPHHHRSAPPGTATPPVFVFVPTVDEGTAIVGATLQGILTAREAYLAAHPPAEITVIVCNDGGVAGAECSDDVIALCASMDVQCVTRTIGGGAKAGNIEYARQLVGATGDALIAIFDADQIPRPEFFVRTLLPFGDRSIGWVQTGQFYGNRDNPVARWADDQQSLFYRLLCPGKAAHDSAFICGTNVVLRAAALDEIGGLPTDSVTEDFAASIQLAPRWRSVYLPGVLAVGLGPVDLNSYLKQQERWARGTLAALRGRWRELFLPRAGGLRAQQRLQYGLAVTHYLCGVRDLVFVLAPVLFLVTGLSGVHGATLGDFFAHFLPYYLLALFAFWHAARGTTSWRAIVIGYGSFPALVRAAWMTAVGENGRFTITPKRRTSGSPWRSAWPHLLVLVCCAGSLVIGVTLRNDPSFWLADFWLVYLCILTSAHLWLVHLDAQSAKRGADALERVPRADPVPISLRRLRGRLAPALAAIAITTACAGGVTASTLQKASTAGPAPLITPGRTAVGISGADSTRAIALQQDLGTPFGLRGRTIEIGDRFDADWAALPGTPWLTLVLGRNGAPNLEASLTAVANGVDDKALTRWATQIAAFGKPIYLTMLPEVDRNYPVTSAVVRGGIPQDVPRAWRHLRQLFADAGATNVAWVWNPADPAHDQSYSPPDSQIDAVAVTLYEYPGTRWAVPETAIAEASARHPGRPLLVETGAAGDARARAAWFLQLGSAIRGRTDVAGLVYHDSGPGESAGTSWSVTADQQGQTAVTHVFTALATGTLP